MAKNIKIWKEGLEKVETIIKDGEIRMTEKAGSMSFIRD